MTIYLDTIMVDHHYHTDILRYLTVIKLSQVSMHTANLCVNFTRRRNYLMYCKKQTYRLRFADKKINQISYI